jgi:acetyltransferase-like isoleucine patch superfamily enzyme
MKLLKPISIAIWYLEKAIDRLLMFVHSSRFGAFGSGALFHPRSTIIKGYENIYLGSHSTIGPNTVIYAIVSPLIIGKKTGIGPSCVLMTGNHSTHVVGKFYKEYTLNDKKPQDDGAIVIQDDVWIGAGCTILKGVTIGRGSVVGAGSLINKNVAPYTIVAGNPFRVLKKRFSAEEILVHEQILYAERDRLKPFELENE